LQSLYVQAEARYRAAPQAARQLIGQRPLPANADPVTWAAWFNLAHVLLNLDETITKN
jgi:hypothetical protein